MFKRFESKVVPLRRTNVDTDQIIPAQFLTSVSKEGFGEKLFYSLRQEDENFPLDQPQYKDASILLVDDNFGCGSSREHAVWALRGAGIQAIVGKSFADIFSSNSAKNGLLLIPLEADVVEKLFQQAEEGLTLGVDLEHQVLEHGNERLSFEYDLFRKHCLLEGLDDIDYILSSKSQIESYFAERKTFFQTTSIFEETESSQK